MLDPGQFRRLVIRPARPHWLRVGDCDDDAVEKLRRLIGLGLGDCARLEQIGVDWDRRRRFQSTA